MEETIWGKIKNGHRKINEFIIEDNDNFFFVELALLFLLLFFTQSNKVLISKGGSVIILLIIIYSYCIQVYRIFSIVWDKELIQNYYIQDSKIMREIYVYVYETILMLLGIFFGVVMILYQDQIDQNSWVYTIGGLVLFGALFCTIKNVTETKVAIVLFNITKLLTYLVIGLALLDGFYLNLYRVIQASVKIQFLGKNTSRWLSIIIVFLLVSLVVTVFSAWIVPNFKITKWAKKIILTANTLSVVFAVVTFVFKSVGEERIDGDIVLLITLFTILTNNFSKLINWIYEIRETKNQKRARKIYRNIMKMNNYNNLSIFLVRECCYYGGDTYVDLLYSRSELVNILKSIELPNNKKGKNKCVKHSNGENREVASASD